MFFLLLPAYSGQAEQTQKLYIEDGRPIVWKDLGF